MNPQRQNVASALQSIPGVWLLAVRQGLVLRDGAEKTDPVKKLSTSAPTFFAKLTPLQCGHNPELIVLADHEPPKAESAAESVARLKAELAKAQAVEKLEAAEAAEAKAAKAK